LGGEGKLQHVFYGNRATDDALSSFRNAKVGLEAHQTHQVTS
jgi:hypothetical protein